MQTGLKAIASLLFNSQNEGVKFGVRNALRGISSSSESVRENAAL